MKKPRESSPKRQARRSRRQAQAQQAKYQSLLARCREEDVLPTSLPLLVTKDGWLDANGLLVLTQQGTQWVLKFLNPQTRRQVCLRISNYLGLRNMLADIYHPA